MSAEIAVDGVRRYRLVRTIAAGGMAQVYEAIADLPGGVQRRVALKRVLPELAADPRYRAMFLDEARVASALSHPSLVAVLDFGFAEGAEFLVFELVDGLDAGEAFRLGRAHDRPLGEVLALHVVAEVACGLDHAHCRTDVDGRPLGIVHRDVSPSNVLVSWAGDVKLGDFGIAVSVSRSERTRTGLVKGKSAFMPPEQAAGERVGPAADVFALGATLHALLTGEPVRDAADIDAAIAPDVRDVISRCLAGRPDSRPSAAELEHVLRDRIAARATNPRLALARALEKIASLRAVPTAFDRALDLLLVGGGSDREFTVERAAPADRATEPERALAAKGAARPPVERPRRSRSALVALGAVAALAAAIAVGWPTPGAQSSDPEPPAAHEPAPMPPPPPPAQPIRVESPAPPPPLAPDEPIEPARAPRRARAPSFDPPAPAAPEPPPAESATGWLRIGGESLLRATVEIDGTRAGHAPLERELPAGTHRIVARDASGAVLLDRAVTVDESHRRAAPLRLLLE